MPTQNPSSVASLGCVSLLLNRAERQGLWHGHCVIVDRRLTMIPPTRVLAAVDFSDSSRVALAHAAQLALNIDAELHVVHVPPIALSIAAQRRGSSIVTEACAELRAFFLATLPADHVTPAHHVVCGDAPHIIRDVAHRESCDLVVVGGRGLSGDLNYPLGLTTDTLLRETDVPVLVVPNGPSGESTGTEIGPVIAALDFTCPSIDAAAAGVRLAARLKTSLVLVHVVSPPQTANRWRADVDDLANTRVDEAAANLAPIRKTLSSIAPVESRVVVGAIATELAEVARTMPNAVLVLGRSKRARDYGAPGTIAARVLAGVRPPLVLQVPS